MTAMKIHEQISTLRKRKGMTQEELANALGVTNQAVSKWESAQCCPDMQLLPELAGLFGVSVDELLGVTPVCAEGDVVPALRRKIEALPEREDADFAFRTAAALHTWLFSKKLTADHRSRNTDADDRAGQAEWDYSAYDDAGFSTVMRQGAVFFSDSRDLNLTDADVCRIVSVITPFCDGDTLRIAMALYRQALAAEDGYATVREIADASGLPDGIVQERLAGALSPFLEKDERATLYPEQSSPAVNCSEKSLEKSPTNLCPEKRYRFKAEWRSLLPLLSLFDVR